VEDSKAYFPEYVVFSITLPPYCLQRFPSVASVPLEFSHPLWKSNVSCCEVVGACVGSGMACGVIEGVVVGVGTSGGCGVCGVAVGMVIGVGVGAVGEGVDVDVFCQGEFDVITAVGVTSKLGVGVCSRFVFSARLPCGLTASEIATMITAKQVNPTIKFFCICFASRLVERQREVFAFRFLVQ
jgi:hypothetical protein